MTIHSLRYLFLVLLFVSWKNRSIDAKQLLIGRHSLPFDVAYNNRKTSFALNHHRKTTANIWARNSFARHQRTGRIVIQTALTLPRGGSAFTPGNNVLSFTENLSGSIFSFLSILYGAACAIDPRGTARILYGHAKMRKTKEQQPAKKGKAIVEVVDDDDTIKFLMRCIGAIMAGVGLTSAFSVASELKVLGQMTPKSSLHHAIAIGLIPRALLSFWYAFVRPTNVSQRIRFYDAKSLWVGTLVETLVLIGSVFKYIQISPNVIIGSEILVSLVHGIVVFFDPSLVFQPSVVKEKGVTNHERLLTRLAAIYTLMSGVLILALHHPNVNAFPAIGLTALTYALSQSFLTFGSKDVIQCGCSAGWSVSMIVLAVIVGIGSLRNHVAFSL